MPIQLFESFTFGVKTYSIEKPKVEWHSFKEKHSKNCLTKTTQHSTMLKLIMEQVGIYMTRQNADSHLSLFEEAFEQTRIN